MANHPTMPRYHNSGFDVMCESDTLFPVWSPDPEELQQILQLLTDSLSPGESTTRTPRREVRTLGETPNFNTGFIITELDIESSPSPQQREPLFHGEPSAGLTYLRLRYSEAIDFLRRCDGFKDRADTIFWATSAAWRASDLEDEGICDGSLGVLHKICDEYADSLSTAVIRKMKYKDSATERLKEGGREIRSTKGST
ncbi:hypothetical protein HPB50_016215 [Hyalomma asiaticum]|uniref:Uncharacterized protein n=1 Tax=Hyalomma asiaticum TaxID=266040 RepID=A0ACB7SBY4_HYAAI|nr:hypothetical protein HPB50_016215 [Hyalomma asiaticum]